MLQDGVLTSPYSGGQLQLDEKGMPEVQQAQNQLTRSFRDVEEQTRQRQQQQMQELEKMVSSVNNYKYYTNRN